MRVAASIYVYTYTPIIYFSGFFERAWNIQPK